MADLYSTLKIKDVNFKNRIGVSPMCQYSAVEGQPTQWHLVHLGTRAIGGAGIIIQEATSISPEGRISYGDLGIWDDSFIESYSVISEFISEHNSIPAIQLAHAGRKASTYSPFSGKDGSLTLEDGAWSTYGPSAVKFSDKYTEPVEMTKSDIDKVILDFRKAAIRSVAAGYKIIELHFAHGYLVNEFMSPLSNYRKDEYGGSFQNRIRLALEITNVVKNTIPDSMPLFVRISASEWVENGWNLEESIELAKLLKKLDVDLIDCSSGGNIAGAKIPVKPCYQVDFAKEIKRKADIMTAAVGLITTSEEVNDIISNDKADIVLMGREMLRNPYFVLNEAIKSGNKINIPDQYKRAY